jgi:hypothetical protein
MVLSKEDRIALLAKAREAKAKKRVSTKDETEDEAEEEKPVINVPMPEPEPPVPKKKTGRKPKEVVELPVPVEVVQIEEEPLPVPKKRVVPNPKWLKQPKTEPEKVCCDKKLTKEEPLIEDKPQVVADSIVIPPKKELVKKRTPRASAPARTLELTPPRDIVEVIDELQEDNLKYRPPQKRQQAPPPQTAPISIRHQDIPIRIFDY